MRTNRLVVYGADGPIHNPEPDGNAVSCYVSQQLFFIHGLPCASFGFLVYAILLIVNANIWIVEIPVGLSPSAVSSGSSDSSQAVVRYFFK
jgi:hypothetical protein